MLQPLLLQSRDVITRGKDLVYDAGDLQTRYLLGLAFPPDGEAIHETGEFLKFRTCAHSQLELQFGRREGGMYPITAQYIKHRAYIRLLGSTGKLVRVVVGLLQKYNNKITEETASQISLEQDTISLWNDCWGRVRDMPQLLNSLYLSPQYRDKELSSTSSLLDILPIRKGGATWYMINTLAAFNNIFSKPDSQVSSVLDLLSEQCVQEIELTAVVNDAWDTEQFGFSQLEASLCEVLGVGSRLQVDIRTCEALLFKPLKFRDTWHVSLKTLDKEDTSILLSNASDRSLKADDLSSVEILIQVSTSPTNILPLKDLASLYNLPPLPAGHLYYTWHRIWLQLSCQLGKIFIPRNCNLGTTPTEDLGTTRKPLSRDHIPASTLSRLQCLLHMITVEWVLHYPGFDTTGLQLREALDLYAEQAGVGECGGVVECVAEGLELQQSVELWNWVAQEFGVSCL